MSNNFSHFYVTFIRLCHFCEWTNVFAEYLSHTLSLSQSMKPWKGQRIKAEGQNQANLVSDYLNSINCYLLCASVSF